MCVIVSSSRSSFVSSSLGVVKSVTEIFFTLISAFFHKVFFNALSLSLSIHTLRTPVVAATTTNEQSSEEKRED
jgi:hypothetical protein